MSERGLHQHCSSIRCVSAHQLPHSTITSRTASLLRFSKSLGPDTERLCPWAWHIPLLILKVNCCSHALGPHTPHPPSEQYRIARPL